ncbi:hypothetical protein AL552_11875 [Vibrio diabolicus]|nr:hypothetical protein AL552_11875 [Vibrio diabolicus]
MAQCQPFLYLANYDKKPFYHRHSEQRGTSVIQNLFFRVLMIFRETLSKRVCLNKIPDLA